MKGEKPVTNTFLRDVIVSEQPDKDLHEWAQSIVEAKEIIKALTFEGQIVMDTFMGSGTTGIAASELGRPFIGFETDLDYFNIARANIAEKFYSRCRRN